MSHRLLTVYSSASEVIGLTLSYLNTKDPELSSQVSSIYLTVHGGSLCLMFILPFFTLAWPLA